MKRPRIPFILYCSFIVLFATMMMVPPVSALRVENARIALDVEPGVTYQEPVALSLSPNDESGSFTIAVAGFGQSPFDGTYTGLDPADDTSPFTARSFMTIGQPVVSLKPGKRAVTNATIAVPADAREGGRYAIILVTAAASGSDQPAPVAVIPVFLSIKGGNAIETGEITALEMTTQGAGDDQVATYFQNTGNHHFYGAVNNVTVTDSSGAIIDREKTPPFDKALIPGQEVRFSVTIGASLPDKEYIVTSRMETQDGTLLAEQKESLQGRAEDEQTTAIPTSRKAPGFSIGCVMSALVLGGLWFRKRSEGAAGVRKQ